jgi:hypothetical protein
MASVFTRLASIILKRKTETATSAQRPRWELPNRFIAGSSLRHDSKCCGNLSDHQAYQRTWAELTAGIPTRRTRSEKRSSERSGSQSASSLR